MLSAVSASGKKEFVLPFGILNVLGISLFIIGSPGFRGQINSTRAWRGQGNCSWTSSERIQVHRFSTGWTFRCIEGCHSCSVLLEGEESILWWTMAASIDSSKRLVISRSSVSNIAYSNRFCRREQVLFLWRILKFCGRDPKLPLTHLDKVWFKIL